MRRTHRLITGLLVVTPLMAHAGPAAGQAPPEPRPRARDLAVAPGVFPPGPLNAITDVAGVRVGQVTLVGGDRVRTGVTTVLPHAGNLFRDKVAGAVFVGNAFGKLAGSTQVDELGTIETPIVLTNTLAVAAAIDGVIGWTLAQPGNDAIRSVNALVGETNDGELNDIRARFVTPAHVREAIERAAGGPVEEGSVGAGTGTVAFGWKGGIGTSSRVLPQRFGELDPGQPHYIHCKSGVRSLKAVEFLKAQGFRDVKSVRGGILAWAQEIDPRVPQY